VLIISICSTQDGSSSLRMGPCLFFFAHHIYEDGSLSYFSFLPPNLWRRVHVLLFFFAPHSTQTQHTAFITHLKIQLTYHCFFFAILGVKLRTSGMISNHSTTELCPCPTHCYFYNTYLIHRISERIQKKSCNFTTVRKYDVMDLFSKFWILKRIAKLFHASVRNTIKLFTKNENPFYFT
jgi:hypothetical protein